MSVEAGEVGVFSSVDGPRVRHVVNVTFPPCSEKNIRGVEIALEKVYFKKKTCIFPPKKFGFFSSHFAFFLSEIPGFSPEKPGISNKNAKTELFSQYKNKDF